MSTFKINDVVILDESIYSDTEKAGHIGVIEYVPLDEKIHCWKIKIHDDMIALAFYNKEIIENLGPL